MLITNPIQTDSLASHERAHRCARLVAFFLQSTFDPLIILPTAGLRAFLKRGAAYFTGVLDPGHFVCHHADHRGATFAYRASIGTFVEPSSVFFLRTEIRGRK